MTCVLRTTPPDILFPILQDFDSFMFHCINDLVGGALFDWSHLKASLPPRLGGLGIRRASAHSSAIFLSSVRACSPLILALSNQVAPHSYTLSAFSSCSFANLSDISSPEDFDVPIVQKSLSRIIDQAAFDSLFSSSPTDCSRALLLSTSIPHAGDWLGVLPSPSLGLHFLDVDPTLSPLLACTLFTLHFQTVLAQFVKCLCSFSYKCKYYQKCVLRLL